MRQLRRLGLMAVLVAGCATIQVSESVVDTRLKPSVRDEVVDGSVEYSVTSTVRGEQLTLEIEQSETCAAITTQRSHRVKSVTRVGDPVVVRMMWLVATLGIGLGAYSYSNAESLAAQS